MFSIDPDIIYFTHSKIRDRFTGCNKLIEETFNEIKNSTISIEDIPRITVYFDGVNYFSQNNRRLYLYKLCKKEGLLKDGLITVHIKTMPSRKKYTVNDCSLTAKPCIK